jgi:YfiH family protein
MANHYQRDFNMSVKPIKSDILNSHRHGFFTREGGVSTGLYSGLNCGLGSDDNSQTVAKNRRLVCQALGANSLTTVYQIHSATVVNADTASKEPTPKADALVTNTTGTAIAVLTADCAPVLFSDPIAGVVGAAHSGWQGAIKGIGAETLSQMENLGAKRKNIRATVGPCISQRNYEVGEEFLESFLSQDTEFMQFFTNGRAGKYHFDLPGFCLSSLRDAGVGQSEWTGHCTYENPDKFFSYRRTTHQSEPDYGRLISVIVA